MNLSMRISKKTPKNKNNCCLKKLLRYLKHIDSKKAIAFGTTIMSAAILSYIIFETEN